MLGHGLSNKKVGGRCPGAGAAAPSVHAISEMPHGAFSQGVIQIVEEFDRILRGYRRYLITNVFKSSASSYPISGMNSDSRSNILRVLASLVFAS